MYYTNCYICETKARYMSYEKMTIEKAKQVVELKTREEWCRLHGWTMEQLCNQYKNANLANAKYMLDRAVKSKDGKYRGFTISELEESVEIYTILSKIPD